MMILYQVIIAVVAVVIILGVNQKRTVENLEELTWVAIIAIVEMLAYRLLGIYSLIIIIPMVLLVSVSASVRVSVTSLMLLGVLSYYINYDPYVVACVMCAMFMAFVSRSVSNKSEFIVVQFLWPLLLLLFANVLPAIGRGLEYITAVRVIMTLAISVVNILTAALVTPSILKGLSKMFKYFSRE